MAGEKWAKVRLSWHTAVHQGLTVKEYRPWTNREPVIEAQFREITGEYMLLSGRNPLREFFVCPAAFVSARRARDYSHE